MSQVMVMENQDKCVGILIMYQHLICRLRDSYDLHRLSSYTARFGVVAVKWGLVSPLYRLLYIIYTIQKLILVPT